LSYVRSKILLATGALCVAAMPSVRAECVNVGPKELLERTSSELVFGAKVAEITRTADAGYRATFDVQRAWKGSVPKRIDVYVWELAAEMPRFEKSGEYLVVAKTLVDERVRKNVGAPESQTKLLTPPQCSGGYSVSAFLRDIGPGYPPK
jgi:hypothetical protein